MERQPPNKRLKLAGGVRPYGSGVFARWRARTFVHCTSAGGRVAPQLKRDPLDSTLANQ